MSSFGGKRIVVMRKVNMKPNDCVRMNRTLILLARFLQGTWCAAFAPRECVGKPVVSDVSSLLNVK